MSAAKRAFTLVALVTSSVLGVACVVGPAPRRAAEEEETPNEANQTGRNKPPTATTPTSTPPPPSNAPTGPVQGAPVLTLLSPASLQAGSAQTLVTLNGTGLSGVTLVDVSGTRVQATPEGDSRVTFQVAQDKLRNSGPLSLTAISGNVNSNSLSLIITSATAATVSSVSPPSTVARVGANTSPSLNIQVTGSGFSVTSQMSFNGQPLQTIFGSPNALTAQIPNSLLATAGTYSIIVTDAGRVSSPITFQVTPNTTAGQGTGTTDGRPCSDFSLPPGYCLTTGANAGTYCDASTNRAYKDFNRCPYGTGAGTGYLTCADANVTGYGCVSTGQYAGLLCSNGYLYQNAQCEAVYGAGAAGARCQVSCATAGVAPTGCVATGVYRGNYCASDGCVYDGTAYNCGAYRN